MLLRFLYDILLFIVVILALPVVAVQRLRIGKYRASLIDRLGLTLPTFQKKAGDQVIWIHTISLGETKAIVPFFHKIKSSYPHAKIVVSTITETGMAEAKKQMPSADQHFYFPVDFSWTMKKLMKRISPDIVIMTESDFWFQFLYYAKKARAKIFLVNGKMSERSFRRFIHFNFFIRKILSCFDKLCVQSSLYKERFLQLGAVERQVVVTGNIKLDATYDRLSIEQKKQLKEELGIDDDDQVVAAASTHFPEEDMILTILGPWLAKDQRHKLMIIPRHPERFSYVQSLLLKKGLSFSLYTQRGSLTHHSSQIILIDAMGVLTEIYQISDLALVCGSFCDAVGGHNIFEPVLLGVPVFFGPHMFSQRDLRDLLKPSGAGRQVTLEDLASSVDAFFSRDVERDHMKKCCITISQEIQGSLLKTWSEIDPILSKVLEKNKI
jgi:3-deoxy-D-manno-octulosonic-acid transferase